MLEPATIKEEENEDKDEVESCTSDDSLPTDPSSSKSPASINHEQQLRENLIKHEEKDVKRARWLAIFTIFALAASLSISAYIITANSDQREFEIAYHGFTTDIVTQVQWVKQYNFALMQQLGASVTSAAVSNNATFPYLTLPDFEFTAGSLIGLGGIESVVFAPLVKAEDRFQWEEYSVANQDWIETSRELNDMQEYLHDKSDSENISSKIYRWDNGEKVPVASSPGEVFAPVWQVAPPDVGSVNVDVLSDPNINVMYKITKQMNHSSAILSPPTNITDMFGFLVDPTRNLLVDSMKPYVFILEPVYDKYDSNNAKMVGLLLAVTSLEHLFDNVLLDGADGITCVIQDDCGGSNITYSLKGGGAKFLGYGDLHDKKFDAHKYSTIIEPYPNVTNGLCVHSLNIYPSASFQAVYITDNPDVYSKAIAFAFIFASILLLIYDIMVTCRQEKTMVLAARSRKIVASLFPSTVVDRLMEDDHTKNNSMMNYKCNHDSSEDNGCDLNKSRPIADFFPDATIMFADIAGFTAWSSTREPFHVFQLLEALYGKLDRVAKSRGIFKVETVGDCYVAACGLPTPRKDHAIVISRFARDCHAQIRNVTRELAVSLGPDVSHLAFRIGLHSGPVTGGVLRGDNARFQLFGDTMNTASRMESTGERNRTQLSKATADLLIAGGKDHWIEQRHGTVLAKGKGELQTYWLKFKHVGSITDSSSVSGSIDTSHDGTDFDTEDDQENMSTFEMRLVDWNVAILQERLKAIVAKRNLLEAHQNNLDPEVISQLHQYVVGIASMYNRNPFHNFSHASHVTMSVTKMLSRVVATSGGYTKGITSDPLALFAVVYSALIHDVDHQGVPNARLVQENAPVAELYNNKSVAEENSIHVALAFLMQPEFEALRACICEDNCEWDRFRELIRMIVLATDIADKDLKDDRNARWKQVFGEDTETTATVTSSDCATAKADKATKDKLRARIVLEHLIQASDVAHMMQHWHIYRKWNECLFREMYIAYQEGRADKNPVEFWYKGEIGFFDFYIIPLASKLSECEVFGTSSAEFLNYAVNNRNEWEAKGREVVEKYVNKYCKDENGDDDDDENSNDDDEDDDDDDNDDDDDEEKSEHDEKNNENLLETEIHELIEI